MLKEKAGPNRDTEFTANSVWFKTDEEAQLLTRSFSASPQVQGPREGARGEERGGADPGARPHPPLSRCAQTSVSLHLYLYQPPTPFIISLCQALSLWVSFDLCPPFLRLSPILSLRSILPLRVPPSTALLLLQRLCVRVHLCAQHYLFMQYFYCTFSMYRYVSIHKYLPLCYSCRVIFSTVTCCTGL